jgi:hypothetical protein
MKLWDQPTAIRPPPPPHPTAHEKTLRGGGGDARGGGGNSISLRRKPTSSNTWIARENPHYIHFTGQNWVAVIRTQCSQKLCSWIIERQYLQKSSKSYKKKCYGNFQTERVFTKFTKFYRSLSKDVRWKCAESWKRMFFFLNVLNNKRKIVLNHTVKGYLSRMHWIVEKSVHKIFDIGMSVKKKCSLNVDKS